MLQLHMSKRFHLDLCIASSPNLLTWQLLTTSPFATGLLKLKYPESQHLAHRTTPLMSSITLPLSPMDIKVLSRFGDPSTLQHPAGP